MGQEPRSQSTSRLVQVHSLDQSTIRVIQDPIRCFLNKDSHADGKKILPNFQNGTEPTMWGTIFHQADISAGVRRIDLGKSIAPVEELSFKADIKTQEKEQTTSCW